MNTIGFSYFKFGYVESVKTMSLAYTKQGRLREVNTLERISPLHEASQVLWAVVTLGVRRVYDDADLLKKS